MKHGAFSRSVGITTKLGLAGLLAAVCGLSAAGPALASTQTCSEPALTQPFLSWGDTNYYTLMSGQTPDNFAGAGWTLSGGAKIVTTQLYDGTTGTVLDLPYGASAISPTMCLSSNYPTARTMIRDLVGAQGVNFYVSYPGQPGWKNTGQLHSPTTAWALSGGANLQTDGLSGWQLGQFEFVNVSKNTETQLYNYYVDPYSKG